MKLVIRKDAGGEAAFFLFPLTADEQANKRTGIAVTKPDELLQSEHDPEPETQPDDQGEQATPPDPKKDETVEITPAMQKVIDQVVPERGKRYATQRIKELAAEFGIEDEDGLRAALKEHDERKKADMSEQERLQAQLEAERKAREQAEATAAKVQRESAVTSAAARLGFADPSDAIALIGDAEDVDAALAKLAEEKPYLLGKKSNPRLDANKVRGDSDSEETDEEKRRRLL